MTQLHINTLIALLPLLIVGFVTAVVVMLSIAWRRNHLNAAVGH